MAFLLDNKPINIYAEQTVNGIRYPHLRDPKLRQQLGVVEVPDPEQYDQRFYWGVGNPKQLEDVTETPEGGEPVTTKGLKSQWVAQTKDTAGKMLAQTDWYVIRASEGVKPMTPEQRAKRKAIRDYSDTLETAILACATVEDLIAVVTNQSWPKE